MGVQIIPADIDWIVAFTNEFANATREAAGEEEDPYPDPSTLGRQPSVADRVVTRELVRIADRLFYMFDAGSAEARVEYLNGMLSESRPLPLLEVEGSRHAVRWEIGDPRLALQAACALALLELLGGREANSVPLGTCHAEGCVDVYVDHSRAGSRLYCSTTCQTRVKVAAFRARHREGRPPQRAAAADQ